MQGIEKARVVGGTCLIVGGTCLLVMGGTCLLIMGGTCLLIMGILIMGLHQHVHGVVIASDGPHHMGLTNHRA